MGWKLARGVTVNRGFFAMKKRHPEWGLIRPVILVIAAGVAMSSLARAQSGWKAGAAKVDITPQEPIALAGYGGTRISQKNLQPLYLKALGGQKERGKIAGIVTSGPLGRSLSTGEK